MNHNYRYIDIRGVFDLYRNNDATLNFVKAYYKQIGYAGRPTWFIQYECIDTKTNHLLTITGHPFLFRLLTIEDVNFFPKLFRKIRPKDLFNVLVAKGILSNRIELNAQEYKHVTDFITKELFREL